MINLFEHHIILSMPNVLYKRIPFFNIWLKFNRNPLLINCRQCDICLYWKKNALVVYILMVFWKPQMVLKPITHYEIASSFLSDIVIFTQLTFNFGQQWHKTIVLLL